MLKGTALYRALRNWRDRRAWARHLLEWERRGRPNPPPHLVKQSVIRRYAQQYGIRTFIETGTFHGDMVEAMRKHFDKMYSIELSQDLCARAKARFMHDRTGLVSAMRSLLHDVHRADVRPAHGRAACRRQPDRRRFRRVWGLAGRKFDDDGRYPQTDAGA